MYVDLSITSVQSINYKLIEDSVYVDLNDTSGFSNYRMAVLIKEEDNDFFKKNIEIQFEDNLIYIEKSFFCKENNELKYILGGDLEDLRSFKSKILSRNIFIKGLINAK